MNVRVLYLIIDGRCTYKAHSIHYTVLFQAIEYVVSHTSIRKPRVQED